MSFSFLESLSFNLSLSAFNACVLACGSFLFIFIGLYRPVRCESKIAESKYPSPKQSDNNKLEQVKVVIMTRPGRTSSGDAADMERKKLIRTVKERKEYDKARAHIFSSPGSPSDEASSQGSVDCKGLCPSKDDNGGCRVVPNDLDKILELGK
ncbi:uncharacterized protein LOC141638872 [Silene latifolia]|uniref:uncharacterized protein LOC141638872 n=1 Tax=Silene latifolia TaxID=37657 RepID=UPI003D78556B